MKEISKKFSKPLVGNQLIVGQIDCGCFQVWPLLGPSVHIRRKGNHVNHLTGRADDALCSVFGNFQFRILKAKSEGKELVEQFRDHDFSNWPDSRKGEALVVRGTAAYFGKFDPELAERDLEEALQNTVTLPNQKTAKRRIASYLEKL